MSTNPTPKFIGPMREETEWSEQLKPAETGGFGKDRSQDFIKTHFGLVDREFEAMVVPDFPEKKARIVAVCGLNNMALAGPSEDGWFISDFYLFHHLLKGLGAAQTWLTCLDPMELVQRYKVFAHGRAGFMEEARRIVLDQSMLSEVADVMVVDSMVLLERTRSAIKHESRQAFENNETLLILLFGHGFRDTAGIFIGGPATSKAPPVKWTLQKSEVGKMIHKSVITTLLLTSCYGGAWTISPDINANIITGATDHTETLSYPCSDSVGRMSGSGIADAVVYSLVSDAILETANLPVDKDPHHSDTYRLMEPRDTSLDSYKQAPSWAAITKIVHDILRTELHPRPEDEMYFSAQHDDWAAQGRSRFGLPLTFYQDRWEQLSKLVSSSASVPTTPMPKTAGVGRPGSIRFGRREYTAEQAYTPVLLLAQQYEESFPGPSERASNSHLHGAIRALKAKSKPMDAEYLWGLQQELEYRLRKVMDKATTLKEYLNLNYVPCHEWDHYSYLADTQAKGNSQLYEDIHSLVWKMKLFPEPTEEEGWPYSKGDEYLAAALVENDFDRPRAHLACFQLLEIEQLFDVPGTTVHKLGLSRRQQVKDKLRSLGKETGKRIRDLSPSKHARRRLEGVFDAESSRSST